MFANNNYAKVWKIYPKDKKDQKYTTVQLSTSRKNKKDNSYYTDFSGYVRMVGDAETKAAELEANDRIKLLSVGVTNSYNKETKKKTADQFVCYDFEFESEKKKAESNSDDFMDMPDDLPVPFAD